MLNTKRVKSVSVPSDLHLKLESCKELCVLFKVRESGSNYALQYVHKSVKEQLKKTAAWTSNSTIVSHSHNSDLIVKSQLWPCRPVCLIHNTHNVLCSDLTVPCRLCNDECKNVKMHIILVIHLRKTKSDCKKSLIGQNADGSPLIDQVKNEISIPLPSLVFSTRFVVPRLLGKPAKSGRGRSYLITL